MIIDVSVPDATSNLLNYLINNGINVPIIIGTTGNLPLDLIEKYSKTASVSLVPNFSNGIDILTNIDKIIDCNNWNIKISEKHHIRKKDSPSGTALLIKESLSKEEISVDSIREGDVLGDHNVILANNFEKIELSHSIKDYSVFGKGCVDFIKFKMDKCPGIHKLGDKKSETEKINKKQFEFFKYSVCGNTFIVLNSSDTINISIPDLVTKISDSENSVGSDGVIFYKECEGTFIWKYYNNDGNLVDFCGNGAQCIAKHYMLKNDLDSIEFENNVNIKTSAKMIDNTISIKLNLVCKPII